MTKAAPTSPVRKGLRTCVGCGRRDLPATMVRFTSSSGPVASVPATVSLDAGSFRGRRLQPQRGAHVHPRRDCLERAAKRGFAKSFRRAVDVRASGLEATTHEAAERESVRLLEVARRVGALRPGSGEGLLVVATDAGRAPGNTLERPDVASAIAQGKAIALADSTGLGRWLGMEPTPLAHVELGALATSLLGVWQIRNAVRPYGVAAAEDG